MAPIANKQLILSSFDIDIWQMHGFSSGAFSLRSSADGFASDLFTSSISYNIWNPYNSSYHFDFAPDTRVQDLIEFRLYFFGSSDSYLITTGAPGNGFTLNGAVIPALSSAIPEPTTLALVGAALFGLAATRKRSSASDIKSTVCK